MDQTGHAGAPPIRERHRIGIKVSAEEKGLIERGATAAKQDISEFVRTAATAAAT